MKMKNSHCPTAPLCLALLLAITALPCQAELTAQGAIRGDTVWSLSESPIHVVGDVMIKEGASLTIEPGVVVRIDPEINIVVDGLLVARGVEGNLITFTSTAPEPWGIIRFTDYSDKLELDADGEYAAGCVLQYCIVERSKGIMCRYGAPLIEECEIRRNDSSGIRVEHGSPVIRNNRIYENSTQSDPASGNGAGIIAFTDRAVSITGNIIYNNDAIDGRYGGGGICAYAYRDGSVEILNNLVFNNYSSTHAGGIFAYKSLVQNNIVIGNRCDLKGGGMNVVECTVLNNLIDSNQGNGGGGLYAERCEVGFNSIVRNRSVKSYGGALYYFGEGDIHHNIMMHNSTGDASRSGGLYVSGNPKLRDNTICANEGSQLYTGNPFHSPLLNARKNFWGQASETGIGGALHDWFKDDQLGLIDYTGFLDSASDQCPPIPPSGLRASSSAGGVQLEWDASPSAGVIGYTVHYSADAGYPYEQSVDTGLSTSHRIAGLSPGKTFHITVTAWRSDDSNPASRSAFSRSVQVLVATGSGEQPDQPGNIFPEDGEEGVDLAPMLMGTAFSGSGHASRWQITTVAGDYRLPIFDITSTRTNPNRISVPSGFLTGGQRYFWRLSYRDERGSWSDWSMETAFDTIEPSSASVSGPLPVDAVWTPDESPYVLTGNTAVREGGTLTIRPGTVVQVQADVSFMVRGRLLAVGTEDRPITFTRSGDAPWGQFVFADLAEDAYFDESGAYEEGSILKHCVVEYGSGVLIEDTSPYLTESLIRFHEGSGITIRKGGPVITQNRIVGNKARREGGGIYVYTNYLALIRDNIIQDNTANSHGGGIFAFGYKNSTAIEIRGNEISGNTAGNNGGGIYASRTAIDGNTISANKANGLGGGIYITFAIVDNNIALGNSAEKGGGIYAERNSTIRNNLIKGNTAVSPLGAGVYINYWGARLENEEFSSNEVTQNHSGGGDGNGVYVTGGLFFKKNNIFDNEGYELYNGNEAGEEALVARNCYWGSGSAEAVEDEIFHQPDDAGLASVTYEPFATEYMGSP